MQIYQRSMKLFEVYGLFMFLYAKINGEVLSIGWLDVLSLNLEHIAGVLSIVFLYVLIIRLKKWKNDVLNVCPAMLLRLYQQQFDNGCV